MFRDYLYAVVLQVLHTYGLYFWKWVAGVLSGIGITIFGVSFAAFMFESEGLTAFVSMGFSFVLISAWGKLVMWISGKEDGG